MPFKSDKQRRYLWSQKPEVAKQIAYKEDGGWIENWSKKLDYANPKSDPGVVKDFLTKAWEARNKNSKQVDEIPIPNEPPKPSSRFKADWNIPIGKALGADWTTHGGYQDMSEGRDPWNVGIRGTWKIGGK